MPVPMPPHLKRSDRATSAEGRNLILLTHPGRQDWHDFEAIGQEAAVMAPDISGYIVSGNDTAEAIAAEHWRRRSLIVSFGDLGRFAPPRGRIFQSAWISKYDEYLLFGAAGVRTPFTSIFRSGLPFDHSKHKPLVVAKPTKMGTMSHGDQVVLMRRERVAHLVPARFGSDLVAEDAPIIVQDFIDPGPRAQAFRVLLLFGEVLYCSRTTAHEPRPELNASDTELEHGRVASNAPGKDIEFIADAEVIEFAKSAARAMWWLPLLGLDVLREAGTGQLYVLESNPGGNTWIFSSQLGEATRRLTGGAEPFKAQFGAWKVAAKALVQATRAYAE